eukprot:Filipodium_phascolosomae@DN7640_c0_g1_i1.p1
MNEQMEIPDFVDFGFGSQRDMSFHNRAKSERRDLTDKCVYNEDLSISNLEKCISAAFVASGHNVPLVGMHMGGTSMENSEEKLEDSYGQTYLGECSKTNVTKDTIKKRWAELSVTPNDCLFQNAEAIFPYWDASTSKGTPWQTGEGRHSGKDDSTKGNTTRRTDTSSTLQFKCLI